MANKTWKAFEKTPFFVTAKVGLKRLVGKELRLRSEVALPTVEHSHWWFAPSLVAPDSVVYSLGVGEDTAFDEALIAEYGAIVHAFDPTPNTIEWLKSQSMPDAFHFHPWAVTAVDGTLTLYPRSSKQGRNSRDMMTVVKDAGDSAGGVTVDTFCLASIRQKLGHGQIAMLKMDIEGAEYEVLDNLIDSDVRPTQLLVEFHHRFFPDGLQRTANPIADRP